MTQEELLQVIEQAAKEGWRTLDLSGNSLNTALVCQSQAEQVVQELFSQCSSLFSFVRVDRIVTKLK